MNKLVTICIIALILVFSNVAPCYGVVGGITSQNYLFYEKKYADSSIGYNKGECNRKYLAGEEFFYNENYDHWNVDEVYNPRMINDKKFAIAYAKATYPKCKVKFITLTNDKNWKKILKRKGKNIVYIEKCISKSSGKDYGYTIKGHYHIGYNKRVKKNKTVISYIIWSPYNNACDGIAAVVDNKMIR